MSKIVFILLLCLVSTHERPVYAKDSDRVEMIKKLKDSHTDHIRKAKRLRERAISLQNSKKKNKKETDQEIRKLIDQANTITGYAHEIYQRYGALLKLEKRNPSSAVQPSKKSTAKRKAIPIVPSVFVGSKVAPKPATPKSATVLPIKPSVFVRSTIAHTIPHPATASIVSTEPEKTPEILFDALHTFDVIPSEGSKEQVRIRVRGRDTKIKIIGEKKGMYEVNIFKNGEKMPGSFFIAKVWAHRAWNMEAVANVDDINRLLVEAGRALGIECIDPRAPAAEDLPDRRSGRNDLKPVVSTSSRDFKKGCEVLSGGKVEMKDRADLSKCIHSIKETLILGARASDGSIDRKRYLCNMYKKLRPEEQHFAGLVLTAAGEGGIIHASGEPKHREVLFIMKNVDNRVRQAQKDLNRNELNALDVAVTRLQYSMYNNSIFPHFRPLFEPASAFKKNYGQQMKLDMSIYNQRIDLGVSAFMSLYNESEHLKSSSNVDHIGNYYNPNGMSFISSLPQEERADMRKRVLRLKKEGKIPANHPDNRVAPAWGNFEGISLVEDLSFKGKEVQKNAHFMHTFYTTDNGRVQYQKRKSGNDMPPLWRAKCSVK